VAQTGFYMGLTLGGVFGAGSAAKWVIFVVPGSFDPLFVFSVDEFRRSRFQGRVGQVHPEEQRHAVLESIGS
jgi:hypothetical protein